MNRTHDPCRACARFTPTGSQKPHEDGPGYCEGNEREAHSTDHPCPLFIERGSRAARLLAEQQRQRPAETISRASAPRGRVTASTT